MENKLTKGDAVAIYTAIREIKCAGLAKEVMTAYIMLRLKLKSVQDEFEQARVEISEQTKPNGWQEGDSTEKWDSAYRPVISEYLSQECDVETKILSLDDAIALVAANPEMPGSVGDLIVELLVK